MFKLYTNGDWTNSERKSNRISTWIICPVISYILNQHHKRLPEAGEFRSYRQILIILPVNVHANDNNSDSSCIGRTAACSSNGYTKRWGGEEGSRDNINHRALRIHATEGGCYTFHSLSLSLPPPGFPSDLFTGLINGRWCFDSGSKSAVSCATCRLDALQHSYGRPENGLPANWTWNCPSGVNKLTSFPYRRAPIQFNPSGRSDERRRRFRISPDSSSSSSSSSLLPCFFSSPPRIWKFSVFRAKTERKRRRIGRNGDEGRHFETANYEQRFVNHYSTFNYGGWMPGMGDIATLVATHARYRYNIDTIAIHRNIGIYV